MKFQVYKCSRCKKEILILKAGNNKPLICCFKKMTLLEPKNQHEGKEKHIPVFINDKIVVGSVPHPMTKEHFIEWIAVHNCDKIVFQKLTESDKPELKCCAELVKNGTMYAFCNIHGLWSSK